MTPEPLYSIVQLTREGEDVRIVRCTEQSESLAETKRAMFSGIEHEIFILVRN